MLLLFTHATYHCILYCNIYAYAYITGTFCEAHQVLMADLAPTFLFGTRTGIVRFLGIVKKHKDFVSLMTNEL